MQALWGQFGLERGEVHTDRLRNKAALTDKQKNPRSTRAAARSRDVTAMGVWLWRRVMLFFFLPHRMLKSARAVRASAMRLRSCWRGLFHSRRGDLRGRPDNSDNGL